MKPQGYGIGGGYFGVWPKFKKEKNMITITKRFNFCYAHYLPDYVGRCSNIHGHNSVLEVEVSGKEADGYQGMIIDFGKLKEIVNKILDRIDHKYINRDLFQFQTTGGNKPPTAEELIKWIGLEIERALPSGIQIQSLRLSETDDSWATWRRIS